MAPAESLFVERKQALIPAVLFWLLLSADLLVFRFPLFGRETLLRGNEFKDLRRRHGEPVGELEQAVKRNGLFGAFYSSYLVPVKVTHLRKLLLGEMPFNP